MGSVDASPPGGRSVSASAAFFRFAASLCPRLSWYVSSGRAGRRFEKIGFLVTLKWRKPACLEQNTVAKRRRTGLGPPARPHVGASATSGSHALSHVVPLSVSERRFRGGVGRIVVTGQSGNSFQMRKSAASVRGLAWALYPRVLKRLLHERGGAFSVFPIRAVTCWLARSESKLLEGRLEWPELATSARMVLFFALG